MAAAASAQISAEDAALIARYLDHVRVDKRLAARTVALYRIDLDKLAHFAAQAGVALPQVQSAHVRRWVAQMHAKGRSGRGIALILSGWRGFYAWLGRQRPGSQRHRRQPGAGRARAAPAASVAQGAGGR